MGTGLQHWRLRSERGQALAEFALAVPLLAIILFVGTELGFMLDDQVSVVNASRDGARVAALQGSGDPNLNSDVQTAVTHALTPLAPATLADSCTSSLTSTASGASGGQIATWTVTVTCTYYPVTPLAPIFALYRLTGAQTSYQIQQSTTMRDTYCFRPGCYP
jgi:Flp pilus assembly protein TadG